MKYLKLLVVTLLVMTSFSLASPAVFASPVQPAASTSNNKDKGRASNPSDKGGVSDPAVNSNAACTLNSCPIIEKYINPFIALLSALVGVVAVIAIIIGAIQVSTSAGDPQKSANGKGHIRNALIGLVAYALLWWFLEWIIPGGVS